jgi:hypothetical protein
LPADLACKICKRKGKKVRRLKKLEVRNNKLMGNINRHYRERATNRAASTIFDFTDGLHAEKATIRVASTVDDFTDGH